MKLEIGRGVRISPLVDDDVALRGDPHQLIVKAFARVHGPVVYATVSGPPWAILAEIEHGGLAGNLRHRQIPGAGRILLNKPQPLFELDHVAEFRGIDALDHPRAGALVGVVQVVPL